MKAFLVLAMLMGMFTACEFPCLYDCGTGIKIQRASGKKQFMSEEVYRKAKASLQDEIDDFRKNQAHKIDAKVEINWLGTKIEIKVKKFGTTKMIFKIIPIGVKTALKLEHVDIAKAHKKYYGLFEHEIHKMINRAGFK